MEPFVDIMVGDVREQLALLPDNFVQCVVTSPPYWGLRDYGVEGQIGNEPTVEAFVQTMVEVFAEVKRVLQPNGSLYLNLGDCYAQSGKSGLAVKGATATIQDTANAAHRNIGQIPSGLKAKDLIGVPWRVAFALQADGWYLREDIIWHKPNPMPESVYDRCTRSHEYLFHLTKSPRYYYDHEAIKEPYAEESRDAYRAGKTYGGKAQKNYDAAKAQNPSDSKRRMMASIANGTGRNKRDVWIIPVQPYRGGHFATFPETLVEPCILATTSEAGQCVKCGAPAKRVIEKDAIPPEVQAQFDAARAQTAADTGRSDGHTHGKPSFRRASRTIGWEDTCECGSTHEPQIVLDPFVGSGRAGIVAKRHGRSFIGIDLNPEYAAQAERNIAGLPIEVQPNKQTESGIPRYAGFNDRYFGTPDAA